MTVSFQKIHFCVWQNVRVELESLILTTRDIQNELLGPQNLPQGLVKGTVRCDACKWC